MTLRVSGILRLIIAAITIFAAGAYAFSSLPHPYFDLTSLAWIVAIGLALYAFSGRFSTNYPEVMIITVSCVLYVLFRLGVLVVYPESLLHNFFMTPKIINASLAYIFFGTVACYLGFAFGCRGVFANGSNVKFDNAVGLRILRFLLALGVIAFVVSVSQYYLIGWQVSGQKSETNFISRYVTVFLDAGFIAMLFFAVFSRTTRSRSTDRLLIIQIFLLAVGPLLLGSRGGLFFSLMALASVKLVMDGNFRIRIDLRKLVWLALVFVFLVIVFYLSMIFRSFRYSDINWSAILDVFSDSENVTAIIETALKDISYRLSAIEAVNFTVTHDELPLYDVSGLVNLQTTILNTIERVVPGRQFDNLIFSEFAYGYMFRPEGVFTILEDGQEDPIGYEWNMYGISYQLFGVSGVLFIFLFTAGVARLIRKLRKKGDHLGVVWPALFTWLLLAWTQNLGLDNLFARTFIACISMSLLLLVVRLQFPSINLSPSAKPVS